eukprot:NODE_2517_length_1180_cov_34.062776_g2299_i0.p1 GENE.NODE_2517_length_1180_cov_34.062776_g2299_i0~~NODE_2517_length_1180_cov_34.062776_g2299_i0.p1  ORF type:complete len:241 (+),score=75.25 NODE_2517_length_1180_cov_34.062776_g2299_i0:73-795(+)
MEQSSAHDLIFWAVSFAPSDFKKTSKLRQKLELPPLDAVPPVATPLQEAINRFIPPREWLEDTTRWVQQASSEPASRLDVVLLQEKLDELLIASGAKETGLCPLRRKFYDECFDELVRQVTVECLERGLLMLRIRDEMRAILENYRTLFESRMGFGFRLALKGELEMKENAEKIQKTDAHARDLERQVEEWKQKIDTMVKQQEERFHEDEKKYAEEINTLKKENVSKKLQLESCCVVQKR